MEGFIAASANLASDMNAREAIRNLAEYLPRAVKDGTDLEARTVSHSPTPVGSRNDTHASNQRTRAGTRAFCLSSKFTAWSWTDYD